MKTSNRFRATHLIPYDRGVWLRVMRVGDHWVTREGVEFPVRSDDGARKILW